MIPLQVRIVGDSPLLMHNSRLANPLDPITKRLKSLTGKRGKTEVEQEEISWVEWLGGLYRMPGTGVACIPGDVLIAAWRAGAVKSKKGLKGTIAAAMFAPNHYPLEGPGCGIDLRDESAARKLFENGFADVRSVRNQQNRVMRTRPRFDTWAFTAEVMLDNDVLDPDDALRALHAAGTYVGIGDFRPACGGSFGRFKVE